MFSGNKESTTLFGDDTGEFIRMDIGAPGPRFLKKAAKVFQDSANYLFTETEVGVSGTAMQYGPTSGSPWYRQQLAEFLTNSYGGDPVNKSDVIITAGATQGLHFIASTLFQAGCPIFIEDPTYFIAIDVLKDDLKMETVAVPQDEEGVNAEALEKLLVEYRKKSPIQELSKRTPYWSMLYLISVYNNPTGRNYSEERCKSLIEIARKHNILLFSEDVYNILHYDPSSHPPERLLAYEKQLPNVQTDGIKGHVISNGTFSKIFSPGLRLGWIESSQDVISLLNQRPVLNSGGSVNHITSQIVAAALQTGKHREFLTELLTVLRDKLSSVIEILKKELPKNVTFIIPKGGYFIWLTLPEDVDGDKVSAHLKKVHRLNIINGSKCFVGGSKRNFLRVSIANPEKEELERGTHLLCQGIREYLDNSSV